MPAPCFQLFHCHTRPQYGRTVNQQRRIMKRHFELYRDLMHRPGPLSRVQREMIAVVVSTLNNCHY